MQPSQHQEICQEGAVCVHEVVTGSRSQLRTGAAAWSTEGLEALCARCSTSVDEIKQARVMTCMRQWVVMSLASKMTCQGVKL